ncbi:unnamed protein product [Mytilus coruscus]|uniref:Uncharacterized protein n=1 Tax=Mytilus coruscus TaxID=42192 RepID=A0A6J8F4D3_MYTCO|nr:unnamed protein product [Mytilus coruscus]
MLDKPVFVGCTILDLSKIIMYDFHYNMMTTRYASNLNLLFTDTDSLLYEIFTDDIYQDMKQFHDYFDTSEYESSYPLYNVKYKKVPGKMKDELAGTPIKEFVGLRPKMYSLIYDVNDGGDDIQKEKRTAKGIAKCAVDQQIRHYQLKINYLNLIRSSNHILYINKVRKTGLCNFDDKRFWKNSINGYAYGHYKIPNFQLCCNVYMKI